MTIYSTISSAQKRYTIEDLASQQNETTNQRPTTQFQDSSLLSSVVAAGISANQPSSSAVLTSPEDDPLAEYISDDEERSKYNKSGDESTRNKKTDDK